METKGLTVLSTTWVNLVTEFGLLPGIRYAICNNGPNSIFITEQSSEPTDETVFSVILPYKSEFITSSSDYGVWLKSKYNSSSMVTCEESDTAENRKIMHRPLSSNGLPTGDIQLKGVGTLLAPIDYYVEAMEGERLSIARIIIHLVATEDVIAGGYGDLTALTNGIQLWRKQDGVYYDKSEGLPLKGHTDWGRWCYDAIPVSYGRSGRTPYFQARWSFTKYGLSKGVILEEGDQLGVRVRDDLSGLSQHTIIAEGTHFGTQNPDWITLLT